MFITELVEPFWGMVTVWSIVAQLHIFKQGAQFVVEVQNPGRAESNRAEPADRCLRVQLVISPAAVVRASVLCVFH